MTVCQPGSSFPDCKATLPGETPAMESVRAVTVQQLSGETIKVMVATRQIFGFADFELGGKLDNMCSWDQLRLLCLTCHSLPQVDHFWI